MFGDALAQRAARHPEREFLRSVDTSVSFEACRRDTEVLRQELGSCAGSRVGVRGAGAAWVVAHLAALDDLGARVYLIPPDFRNDDLPGLSARLGLRVVISEGGDRPPPGAAVPAPPPTRGEIVIFTSGTTGLPKPSLHTWKTLANRVHVRPDLEGACWLTCYDLSTFAGLQVLLHVLSNGGTLVLGATGPSEAVRAAREAGVTHMSGTPSFLRRLLSCASRADLCALRVRQVTLGGEAPDQTLLDAVKRQFPGARITQLYASTEMGVCFSVHDGRAGFPSSYLDNQTVGARLLIVRGELHIGSTGAMRGYLEPSGLRPPEELFPTGDLVELRGDRVVFRGRREGRINVGGSKALPEEIEAAVREVPGVRDVRVSGTTNSLVGQIVRAEVALEVGVDAAEARRRILAHCRERLRPHMVPRLVEFVDDVGRTGSGKLLRS
jgi:acyl-CoA synthetase (AMP-forming)/AMP-acid ligase II